eukprot:GFYU01004268.1.p1 GENE.GFYU01004268.1~~GFYU01004268.1.p1  ORF type:complete len:695 (+),score=157.08 GFYU01004268.1:253-2337(+)
MSNPAPPQTPPPPSGPNPPVVPAAGGAEGPLTPNHFEFGKCLGEGSFARVFHARKKDTKEQFAIKVLKKKQFLKENKVKYVKMEKNILAMLNHPNIIRLHSTFQDPSYLYFVLEFGSGGELFRHIRRAGACDVEPARFYTAEILLALECLKENGVVHRDMKPENILLSKDMHVKVSDFGTAKIVGEEVTHTFCGTAEYVSPEVLKDKAASYCSDLWALGCILYQMLAGRPPFKADNEYLTFQKILKLDYHFPDEFDATAKDLVKKLIVLDPNRRLGSGEKGFADLKAHPFFKGIDFENIHTQTPPPIVSAQIGAEQRAAEGTASHAGSIAASEHGEDVPTPPSTPVVNVKPHPDHDKWTQFLFANEIVVHCGLLLKKRKMSSKKRVLILTNFPRMFYVDADSMEQKGEVVWSSQVKAELKDNSNWILHTPKRDYVFEEPNKKAGEWCDAINKMLKQKESTDSEITKRFLLGDEKVIYSSQVWDRKGFGRKRKRSLMMTDFPRFICVNEEELSHKFDIRASEDMSIDVKDNANFILSIREDQWQFEDANCEAGKWAEEVTKLRSELQLRAAELKSSVLEAGESVNRADLVLLKGANDQWEKRNLVLTDKPRLLSAPVNASGADATCIEWAEKLKCELKDPRIFTLTTSSGKTYTFQDICGGGKEWIDTITKNMQFADSKERGESVFQLKKSSVSE